MTSMATDSKRKPPLTGKRSPRPPLEPPAPPSAPFLRFYHSEALRKKTLSVLNTLERAPDATRHRDALANIVVELTNSGLDHFFIGPLELAKPGFMVEQSAKLGLQGVRQVMAPVIRQIVGRMNGPQLLSVCGSIRQFMV